MPLDSQMGEQGCDGGLDKLAWVALVVKKYVALDPMDGDSVYRTCCYWYTAQERVMIPIRCSI
jgi:hypothetical protein